MNKPKLIIMVGNICSGKTTWIKKFLQTNPDYIVISKDDIRRMFKVGKYVYDENLEPTIHNITITITYRLLEHDKNVIIDETNLTKLNRQSYLNLTKKFSNIGFNCKTIAVVIENTNKEELKRRIALRQNDISWGQGSIEHWLEVWQNKSNKYEEPTIQEGFDEIRRYYE
jgi:predicted kinase